MTTETENKAKESSETVDETREETQEHDQKESDAEKTVDELKAEAEEAERQYREARDSHKEQEKEQKRAQTEEEIRRNMIIRKEKALDKLNKLKGEPKVEEDLNVRDLLALDKAGIPEDSEKAKLLARYKKGGIIASYAEGLDHAGIKAEFEAIDASHKASTVVDESDQDEYARTTKEVILDYKRSGDVPSDPKLRNVIAEENLKEMGL